MLEMVCLLLILSGSLFHSTSAAMAKPRLPMAFPGQAAETDSLFPCARLLDLIKDDNWWGWENL